MLPSYDFIKFSDKIKLLRNTFGFTIDNVSFATGISTSTIKALERGQTIPRFDTLQILSGFYKIDLICLLNECKDSSNILHLYYTLNNYMASGNSFMIKKAIIDVSRLLESDELKPVENRNLQQLKIYFKGLETASQCSASTPTLNENTIKIMIDALKITNSNFSLDSFESLKYFSVEYNILFSISSLLGFNRKCEKSNQILLHVLKFYLSLDLQDSFNKLFCTKTIYMLSYNYHRMDQHKLALEYAEMGIQFCNDNDTFQHLPLLLARKSTALYYLDDPEWELYSDQTIALLKIQNKHEQLNTYEEVFNKLRQKKA